MIIFFWYFHLFHKSKAFFVLDLIKLIKQIVKNQKKDFFRPSKRDRDWISTEQNDRVQQKNLSCNVEKSEISLSLFSLIFELLTNFSERFSSPSHARKFEKENNSSGKFLLSSTAFHPHGFHG